jgi:hypothetical protein
MKTILRLLSAGALLGGLSGCGALNLLGGTDVDAVAHSVQKPANVAVYLEVTESDEPVIELDVSNFEVSENDQVLSADDIGLRLLSRAPLTNERVVLLVDISGKPTPELKRTLASAVEGFVERVRSEVPVSVLAYDGSPGLKAVGEYPVAPAGSAAPSAAALESIAAGDESRDLFGAVLKGVKELDVRMMQQKKPVHVGTLVVFARGPDLAGRVSELQAEEALENKSYDVIGIGLGEDTPYLDGLAEAGVLRSHSPDTLPITFEDAAALVMKTRGKYYLLAYCSPGRAGTRALRIDVRYTTKDNDERHASYYYEFDAQGFGPGCNPDTQPRFVVPPPENEAARAGDSRSSSGGESAPSPAEATESAAPSGEKNAPGSEVAPPPDKPEYK